MGSGEALGGLSKAHPEVSGEVGWLRAEEAGRIDFYERPDQRDQKLASHIGRTHTVCATPFIADQGYPKKNRSTPSSRHASAAFALATGLAVYAHRRRWASSGAWTGKSKDAMSRWKTMKPKLSGSGGRTFPAPSKKPTSPRERPTHRR